MREILILHPGEGDEARELWVLGRRAGVRRLGWGHDPECARRAIAEADGRVDAIGLEALPVRLELGTARREHATGARLAAAAGRTPVLDGSGLRAGLERWAVILAERAEPGIFNQKRTLMVPGLNHRGLADALGRRAAALRYADPHLFFHLPELPAVGRGWTLERAAGPTLHRLAAAPPETFSFAHDGAGAAWAEAAFRWADVLAGDAAAVLAAGPERLSGKTVVAEWATEADAEALAERGAEILVSLMPRLDEEPLGAWSAAAVEAVLVGCRDDPGRALDEDAYLDMMAELDWRPEVRYLQPESRGVHRFAFVIHPLDVGFIHRHPPFWWTRFLPDPLVEAVAARVPPMRVGRVTGGRSPATGQRIEGELISLGATPRQLLSHGDRFTYDRLARAARMAERKGARIMGLGAFTSVVGDAGLTVAHEAGIAITSGNSLTVAATLEAAKQAVRGMGREDLTRGRAMVIGATGSIGSVCARLLAQAIRDVVLVSIEPEKLIDLKRIIQAETPGSRVVIATHADELAGDCDLVVTATSAFGQRILNVGHCKPGAVICDVARPTDIAAAEAALRPDVLVIESGEVEIPGEVEIGYDIGLPPKTVYACLAETALLAMEGRFESFTLGRRLEMERVKEIYRLFRKHDFRLAGLRSFDRYVGEEELADKRRLAAELAADPERLERHRRQVSAAIATMPPAAKGVGGSRLPEPKTLAWLAGGVALGAALVGARRWGR